MSRFRFVYFDAAGTLISPHPSVGEVYLEAGAPLGLLATPEGLNRAFTRAWIHYTQGGPGGPMSAIADEAATRGITLGEAQAILPPIMAGIERMSPRPPSGAIR